MNTKKCNKCKSSLPMSSFKGRVYKNGNIHYESSCKECCKKYFSERWFNKLKNKKTEITNMPEEVWLDVNGFESLYQISNMGRIKSLDKKILHSDGQSQLLLGRLLRPSKLKEGYLRVTLVKDGIRIYESVHVIVARHFVPNPDKLPEVNHLKGIKDDNRASELGWSTHQDNCIHRSSVLKRVPPKGELNKKSKLVAVTLSDGNVVYINGAKETARRLNISHSNVYRILQNMGHSTKEGYSFKYA